LQSELRILGIPFSTTYGRSAHRLSWQREICGPTDLTDRPIHWWRKGINRQGTGDNSEARKAAWGRDGKADPSRQAIVSDCGPMPA